MMKSKSEKYGQFFILGSGRSGTSLLRRMLNAHPLLAVPPESHFYTIFYPLRHLYEPLADEENVRALVVDALKTFHMRNWHPQLSIESILASVQEHSFRGIFEAIMQGWMKGQKKLVWGEKTPQHVYHCQDLCRHFPDARFVHLVRDGRDVALSYTKARFGPKGFASAAYRWKKELQLINTLKSSLPEGRLLEIRYEELVAESERCLKRVCSHLGVVFSRDMLDCRGGLDSGYLEKTNRENLGKNVLAGNVAKWTTALESKAGPMLRAVHIFESIAGAELQRYGYDLHFPAKYKVSGIERRLYFYLNDVPRKAMALPLNVDGMMYELCRQRIKFGRLRRKYLESVNYSADRSTITARLSE